MEPAPSDKKRQQPPPIEFLRPGETQAPPQEKPQGPVAWVPSPEEFQRRPAPAPTPARPSGSRGRWAGLCLFVSAALGFVGILSIYLVRPTMQDYWNLTNMTDADLAYLGVLQTLLVWPQVFGLLGGIMAVERKNYRLAAACAFVSSANIFSPYFLGTLFGLLGLVILISARHEFIS